MEPIALWSLIKSLLMLTHMLLAYLETEDMFVEITLSM
jgi:hypothetical protein